MNAGLTNISANENYLVPITILQRNLLQFTIYTSVDRRDRLLWRRVTGCVYQVGHDDDMDRELSSIVDQA